METKEISIQAIVVSEFNVRKNLDDGQHDSSIEDLARNIQRYGLRSPVEVIEKPDGRYELVVGQRRFLACQILGWSTIRATVYEYIPESEAIAISLAENLHRADMNPMDKARALQMLLERLGSLERIRQDIGMSTRTIRKYIQLLQLAPGLQAQLAAGDIKKTEALARLAQRFDDPHKQMELWNKIKGFNQDEQLHIINKADDQLSNVDPLVGSAAEGNFGMQLIRNCPFDCPTIPSHLKAEVARIIEGNGSASKRGG